MFEKDGCELGLSIPRSIVQDTLSVESSRIDIRPAFYQKLGNLSILSERAR